VCDFYNVFKTVFFFFFHFPGGASQATTVDVADLEGELSEKDFQSNTKTYILALYFILLCYFSNAMFRR